MLAGIFSINTAFAETIPYPKDLVIKPDEGAVSAPAEINHTDSMYFTENDFYNMTQTADRIILKNYPIYQQTTEYTCGPASALTVLYFFGEKHYDEMTLAKEMKTQPYPIGFNPKDMSKFF